MNYAKKSLGQNFLIDKNIINKIINLVDIKNKNIIEIGPGKGALTDLLLLKKPKSLIIIEKDFKLYKKLKFEYTNNKKVIVYNADILKFKLEKIIKNNSIIFGNLPYNISSQILVKILRLKKKLSTYSDLILMFQKELGDKITGKFPSAHYGRLSILSNYKLNIIKKFQVSPNCFLPKPKVTSLVIHFQPKKKFTFNIKDLINLEKITNILFSNTRNILQDY